MASLLPENLHAEAAGAEQHGQLQAMSIADGGEVVQCYRGTTGRFRYLTHITRPLICCGVYELVHGGSA